MNAFCTGKGCLAGKSFQARGSFFLGGLESVGIRNLQWLDAMAQNSIQAQRPVHSVGKRNGFPAGISTRARA